MDKGSHGIPPSSDSSENTWPTPHHQAPIPTPHTSHPPDAPSPLAYDGELNSVLATRDTSDNPEIVNLFGPEQLSITVGPEQEQEVVPNLVVQMSIMEAAYQEFLRNNPIQCEMDRPIAVPSNYEGTNDNNEAVDEHPPLNIQYLDVSNSEVDERSDEEFVNYIAEAIKVMDTATKQTAKKQIGDIICKAHSGEL